MTTRGVAEIDARELAERILGYFDSYRLGSVAPIVYEIERALDTEYRRGVREAMLSVPTVMIAADGQPYRLNDHGLWEHADD